MHAARIEDDHAKNDVFEIKIMNDDYNCLDLQHLRHRQVSAAFISAQIQEKLRDQDFYHSKEIQQDIRRKLEINLSYQKAIRAKTTALQAINDIDEELYHALFKYYENLNYNNSDSKIVLDSTVNETDQRFQHMFVCYNASAMNFKFC